jgi:hypothetical protein
MQTKGLPLASGMPTLFETLQIHALAGAPKGTPMSDTSIRLTRSAGFFGRIMAVIDRALMANARLAARNGDLPYFGL